MQSISVSGLLVYILSRSSKMNYIRPFFCPLFPHSWTQRYLNSSLQDLTPLIKGNPRLESSPFSGGWFQSETMRWGKPCCNELGPLKLTHQLRLLHHQTGSKSQSPVSIVGIGHLGLLPLAVARHTLCLLQAVGLQVGMYPLQAESHRLKTLTSSSPFCLGRPSQGEKQPDNIRPGTHKPHVNMLRWRSEPSDTPDFKIQLQTFPIIKLWADDPSASPSMRSLWEEKSHCWDVTLVVFLLPVFNWTDFLFIMSDRNNMFRHFNDSMLCTCICFLSEALGICSICNLYIFILSKKFVLFC